MDQGYARSANAQQVIEQRLSHIKERAYADVVRMASDIAGITSACMPSSGDYAEYADTFFENVRIAYRLGVEDATEAASERVREG